MFSKHLTLDDIIGDALKIDNGTQYFHEINSLNARFGYTIVVHGNDPFWNVFVTVRGDTNETYMRGRWADFVQDNNLGVGDFLEFIREPPRIRVRINNGNGGGGLGAVGRGRGDGAGPGGGQGRGGDQIGGGYVGGGVAGVGRGNGAGRGGGQGRGGDQIGGGGVGADEAGMGPTCLNCRIVSLKKKDKCVNSVERTVFPTGKIPGNRFAMDGLDVCTVGAGELVDTCKGVWCLTEIKDYGFQWAWKEGRLAEFCDAIHVDGGQVTAEPRLESDSRKGKASCPVDVVLAEARLDLHKPLEASENEHEIVPVQIRRAAVHEEEAFNTTDRVMTVSFHEFGDYFPRTEDVRDTGFAKGKYYSLNLPLDDGVSV